MASLLDSYSTFCIPGVLSSASNTSSLYKSIPGATPSFPHHQKFIHFTYNTPRLRTLLYFLLSGIGHGHWRNRGNSGDDTRTGHRGYRTLFQRIFLSGLSSHLHISFGSVMGIGIGREGSWGNRHSYDTRNFQFISFHTSISSPCNTFCDKRCYFHRLVSAAILHYVWGLGQVKFRGICTRAIWAPGTRMRIDY